MPSSFENLPNIGKLTGTEKVVVLTGAGVSAESGLKTFRDSGGIWEQYSIYEVATPEAWERDPETVQRFYNERRKQLLECEPNEAHHHLARLQERFPVKVVTQNIDDLHERAGSKEVLHLHGELRKARSSVDENLLYDIEGWEIKMGAKCDKGSQLRPHVVWFGEMVPMIEPAVAEVREADILLIVGTSLEVYPAAGLVHEAPPGTPVFLVDPGEVNTYGVANLHHIKKPASLGVKELVTKMLEV